MAGNPGKRKVNKAEPLIAGEPSPPTVMTPRAKTVWKRLVLAMPPGVYALTDSYVLAAYCEAVATHQLATDRITKGPHETTGSTGQTKLSHWFSVQADAARLIISLGAKLGLDPVSRQQLNSGNQAETDSEFDGLIN